jgi:L-histidine Nalpha-methyltransferase
MVVLYCLQENWRSEMALGTASVEELLRVGSDWMLCFVGDDQFSQLGRLMKALSSRPSATGDGKKIESGFSYWGVGPTLAWQRACSDPTYLVMKEGIDSFSERWDKVKGELLKGPRFHYASLGVGTGEKDAHILHDLSKLDGEFCYFPIDMSAEMLRIGVKHSTAGLRGRGPQTYPIQIDFSDRRHLDRLKLLIVRTVADEPVLFSILGNTIGNFFDDAEIFQNLARLLRRQDMLLVELAYTEVANDDTAALAADEYEGSERFRLFVTSALLHNTDLPIDLTRVKIVPKIEEGRAISLRVLYTSSPKGEDFTLPNRSKVPFPRGDTIRILLTRKYTRAGIASLHKDAGCFAHSECYERFSRDRYFGTALHLLGQLSGSIFVSFSHSDDEFVRRLDQRLRVHGIYPWIDFNDTNPDSRLYDQIEHAVLTADKLLLVFSETSKDSEWVKAEVRLAFKKLADKDLKKLRVLLLSSPAEFQQWQCLDDKGVNLSGRLLEWRQIDFSGWRHWDMDTFEDHVKRLAAELRD